VKLQIKNIHRYIYRKHEKCKTLFIEQKIVIRRLKTTEENRKSAITPLIVLFIM